MPCDAEDCGFQMLNDNEIVTFVQEESDPVDDETDEDEDNNNNNDSSKGSSNADAFYLLETAMHWYVFNIRVLSYSITAAQENQRPFSEKTVVYNGTAKNKGLFSTIIVKLRHFAPILLFIQAFFSQVMLFNICIVSGFICCMIRFSIIRTMSSPN
ncbi:uncharacterized protein TNCV_268641 [Trichonephila clavipes]|nr:uncharacterized protein TNCV_268641 [Trichonephila clavipes]